jgi:hypothetical protein
MASVIISPTRERPHMFCRCELLHRRHASTIGLFTAGSGTRSRVISLHGVFVASLHIETKSFNCFLVRLQHFCL